MWKSFPFQTQEHLPSLTFHFLLSCQEPSVSGPADFPAHHSGVEKHAVTSPPLSEETCCRHPRPPNTKKKGGRGLPAAGLLSFFLNFAAWAPIAQNTDLWLCGDLLCLSKSPFRLMAVTSFGVWLEDEVEQLLLLLFNAIWYMMMEFHQILDFVCKTLQIVVTMRTNQQNPKIWTLKSTV